MANFIICDPFIAPQALKKKVNLLMRKNELDAKFEEFKNKLKDLQQTFF
ncbi:hypothetical protein [Campylobacter upsaliensis]|nr:hypothetical protein [Campylobacter upsaliensis]EDP6890146.1 hypothetical protein [Campylobacter upsaliensis]EDP6918267.1 hypothetical protein [Campylobacter upsaliensis]EEO7741223.1 hypothetical protein [Campylobacter upsaliensis]EFO9428705.1 hypothetical protein [Campylobacter upsaliensis]EFV4184160.1 hypothetical protein [Campylobacter upsaliensis]